LLKLTVSFEWRREKDRGEGERERKSETDRQKTQCKWKNNEGWTKTRLEALETGWKWTTESHRNQW
jgi:hypothetical protein